MRFTLSKEDEAFRNEVKEFLAKEVPPEWTEVGRPQRAGFSSDQIREIRKQLSAKAAKRGWLAMTWPPEYGGSNASHVRSMIFEEEVAYVGAPVRDMLGISLAGSMFMKFGSKEQKQKHLPLIARGEVCWCEGLSEPGAGSDLASIQSRAVETEDGWLVNGQKIWTSGAHYSDWVFLLLRTNTTVEKHRGLSVFVADLKTPGITIRPLIGMNGLHLWNEVFFDDVYLPEDSLIGQKDNGWPMMAAILNIERVSLLNVMASARHCFEDIVHYLKENKPDALQDQSICQRLSQQVVEFNVTRGLQYQVAWLEDRGVDCTAEASMYKILSGNCLRNVTDLAMELLGLYSQLIEGSLQVPAGGRIPYNYLDSFGWSLGGGTHEIQRNIIARRGLGLPSERTRVT